MHQKFATVDFIVYEIVWIYPATQLCSMTIHDRYTCALHKCKSSSDTGQELADLRGSWTKPLRPSATAGRKPGPEEVAAPGEPASCNRWRRGTATTTQGNSQDQAAMFKTMRSRQTPILGPEDSGRYQGMPHPWFCMPVRGLVFAKRGSRLNQCWLRSIACAYLCNFDSMHMAQQAILLRLHCFY